MTNLVKPISRVSSSTVWERGRRREVIITLEPPSLLGFRLKGTRRTFYLQAGECYDRAVKAQVMAEKKAKREAKKKS